MRILGFDISSTTIGVSLIETNEKYSKPKLKLLTHIKPPKNGSLFERLHETKLEILKILEEHSPDVVAIEEIVQFMAGGSTAKTIITLTAFNRMVGLVAYEHFNKEPFYYSVMAIRHKLKIGKELPSKEQMLDVVQKHIKVQNPILYKESKKGIKKIADETFDQVDGLAVALCCYYDLKENWGSWWLGQKDGY